MAKQISALIPAYNEADLIGRTVDAALKIGGVSEVVVIDDASTDGTADAAQAAGADKVLRLAQNKGKGGALNEGLGACGGEILLLLDADLGDSAVEAGKLLDPVLSGDADMTIAVFGKGRAQAGDTKQAARSGGFGMVVKSARFGIRMLTGTAVKAPLSGQRALRREIVEKCGGFGTKFGVEVALTIDALRLGYRVQEVPVDMVHRPSGRDLRGFIHRGRQLADVLRILGIKALRR